MKQNTPPHKLQQEPAEGDRATIERELARRDRHSAHGDTGGSLDIRPEDVQGNITEETLKRGQGGERADPTPAKSVRAVVRDGRDEVLGAPDVDESEDNRAPGAREQP